MHRVLTAACLWLASAAALAGCGLTLDLTPPDPVPTTGMDAGTPPEDAGALDAGTPPEDAGALDGDTPPEDAGAVDSGEGPEDAGPETRDAGVETLDAGPETRDAGPEARDAGPRPIDAGMRCASDAECSDGIPCTEERCVGGMCVGYGALPDTGVVSAACADSAECTEDRCVPRDVPGRDANGCVHVPIDTRCADFLPTAGTECVTRVCGGSAAVSIDSPLGCALQLRSSDCAAGTSCRRSTGDGAFACIAPVSRSTPTTYACRPSPTPGAISDCDDGNPCNGQEQCVPTPGVMGTWHCEPGRPPDCPMSIERCTRTFCGLGVSGAGSTAALTCLLGPDPSCFP